MPTYDTVLDHCTEMDGEKRFLRAASSPSFSVQTSNSNLALACLP